MKKIVSCRLLFILLLILSTTCGHPGNRMVKILPPEDLYGQLFIDVQSNSKKILGDSKTFVDCIPKYDIDTILKNYTSLKNKSNPAVVRNFLLANFLVPLDKPNFKSDSSQLNVHITNLWTILKRPPDLVHPGTLIPLQHAYIVPGGRFREIYYWDSYFTMLGLQTDHQIDIIQEMIDNFSDLMDRYGFIPNGNRTYYLTRSQPPFYALMISILAESKGNNIYQKYLKYMEKEYDFWMHGKEKLNDSITTYQRVVKLNDGEILNRYWDENNTPRAESYLEDKTTVTQAKATHKTNDTGNIYRNLRAAAESGWDFSSRWLVADKNQKFDLITIHTTDVLPVDLNSLLYNLEFTISKAYQLQKNTEKAEEYKQKYMARKKALIKYCWSKQNNFFMDYNFVEQKQTAIYSLAGLYPLFLNIADNQEAKSIAKRIQLSFLEKGGVVSTLNATGQQWDFPNGWAPLEWITIKGLRNYGYYNLATDIKQRWLKLNLHVYTETHKMLEKYNVVDMSLTNGGGEYPTQDGFGWTNGVYQKLSKE